LEAECSYRGWCGEDPRVFDLFVIFLICLNGQAIGHPLVQCWLEGVADLLLGNAVVASHHVVQGDGLLVTFPQVETSVACVT
jgi:hypothetical protein